MAGNGAEAMHTEKFSARHGRGEPTEVGIIEGNRWHHRSEMRFGVRFLVRSLRFFILGMVDGERTFARMPTSSSTESMRWMLLPIVG